MGRAASVLAVVLAATVVTPPASAAEAAAPGSGGRSRLAASTAARIARLKPARQAFAQTQQPAADSSGTGDSHSFFRSKTGIAAIVLMVAGAAYVAYSIPKDNEKVHSPIR
jgi:hypothetical protein